MTLSFLLYQIIFVLLPIENYSIMNKLSLFKYVAAIVLAFAMINECEACTNLIVGKNASTDGSVICTYNCDGYGFAGSMGYIPAGRHAKGEKIPIREWGSGDIRGYVDQVEYTYSVVGHINEKQVCIVETTFDGRLELVNEEGYLDYDSMIKLGLERAATAREAIKIMTDLVERYGYNSSGETITICDKNEAWIMEIIGKGSGRKGAVWVALRVPDDCICAHANISRIRQIPFSDKQNCMYSKDVVSFAREKGYFKGKDADFSFRDAYCPIDFENVRYADARVWSFFRHHYDTAEMDKYLPYINGGFDQCDHLPLWIKPKEKVSVRDIMNDMRDHFEGTPLDMTADMSAGPWGMPIRPMPMTYKANADREHGDTEKTYFVERPIATQKTAFTLVSQLRSWLPDAVGGVMYYNCDDANMIAYVPVYCGITDIPDAFRRENNNYREFSEKSAFWMNNFVANMVYPRYSLIIPDLREAQKELEDYYAKDVAEVTESAQSMTARDITALINKKSQQYTTMMMQRWDKLARLIIVKHNDLIMLPSKNGELTPGKATYPGYNQSYYDRIAKDTGDRYEMRQVIYRRER